MPATATDLDVERESSFAAKLPMTNTIIEEGDLPNHLAEWMSFVKKEYVKDEEGIMALLLSMFLHDLGTILHKSHPTEIIESWVTETNVNFRNLYDTRRIVDFWPKEEKATEDLELEATLAITSEFSRIEKVQSIYIQRYREELQIYILLSIYQYNSSLMDTLLDIEYDIRKKFPEVIFEFFYPPTSVSEKQDFIHPQAYCIYSR